MRSAVIRWLAQYLVQHVAREQLSKAVRQTMDPHGAARVTKNSDNNPKQCQLAVLCADAPESGGLIDRMQGVTKTTADGFQVHRGRLGESSLVVAQTGPSFDKAAQATEAVILAYRPRLVIATGFATALCPDVRRNDLVIANRIASSAGKQIVIDVASPSTTHRHVGTIVSTPKLPVTPAERNKLQEQTSSVLVAERVAWPVARVCGEQQVPMMSVHLVTFEVDQEQPADIDHLAKQRSLAGKAGALVGGMWRRPGVAKDLWNMQQETWEAGERLANFIAQLVDSQQPGQSPP